MKNQGTVILVEDEPHIRRVVKEALEVESWKVIETDYGQRALIELNTRKPDLLIIDLGLPDIDGIEVIKQFRQWSMMPILVISARHEEHQKIMALDKGADDYITKPFGIGELLARVRAVTRRKNGNLAPSAKYVFGEIEVDLTNQTVMRNNETLHLTAIEYRLLALLIANEGKIISQKRLLQEVWGPNSSDKSHYSRIYISHLRHKLEKDPTQPEHLLTEVGVGYRFQP